MFESLSPNTKTAVWWMIIANGLVMIGGSRMLLGGGL